MRLIGLQRICEKSVWLIVLCTLISYCRATNPHEEAAMLSDEAASEPWYDSAGSPSNCDAPAPICTNFKDERDFVDTCVAKGFKAKTCGCVMRCSSKFAYQAPPADPGQTGQAQNPGTTSGGQTCDSQKKIYISGTLAARIAGTSLDRCLDSHVCSGNLGWCDAQDKQVSTKLRELANQGCHTEVFTAFCHDSQQETFACSETKIAMLSGVWSQWKDKDSKAKTCIRNVVCNETGATCTDAALPQATVLKSVINSPGCEYWLRAYCSFGGATW